MENKVVVEILTYAAGDSGVSRGRARRRLGFEGMAPRGGAGWFEWRRQGWWGLSRAAGGQVGLEVAGRQPVHAPHVMLDVRACAQG